MIHNSSVIDKKAKIGKNVVIGPFCYVGPEVQISDEVESTIKKYVSSIKNGEIKLTKKKDESLIAGFTLDFDNTRLDASIRKRLNMMKKQLKTN